MNAHSPIELKVSTAQSALFHGDAFALVEQLPASSLDLVISSPPYNIGKEYERGMFSSLDAYKEKMETLIESLSSKLKDTRSEEHTSELQSLMRNSYAVFCLKQKKYQLKKHRQKTK